MTRAHASSTRRLTARGRGPQRLLALAVATSVAGFSSPTWASPPSQEGDASEAPSTGLSPERQAEFDQLLGDAATRFDGGDFQGAVDAFTAAYEIHPDSSLLYNIGRVYEEMGELELAIEYYSNFARRPGIKLELREQATQRVKVLKDIVNATSEEASEPAPVSTEPTPVDETSGPAATEASDGDPGPDGRGMRIAGYTMLGVGGALLVGGGVLGGLASADASDLEGEDDASRRDDLRSSGETKALTADILFVTGGAVAVTGLALVVAGVVKKRRVSDRQVSIAPVLSPTYGGASLHLSF